MNDIRQFKSILKQGISWNTDVLLGCEFLEKLLNIINDYENTKNQLQQKENIIKEVREYIEEHLEREYFDYDILEANTIYNRDLYKVLKILDKAGNSNERNKDNK